MDYKLIADKTLEVYIECGIDAFPINCFQILEHYGFKTYTYSQVRNQSTRLYEMCRRYSNDAFKYHNIICYNQQLMKARIRFSLMHELGHYLLKHSTSSDEAEIEADYFASCVLAPRIALWKSGCRTADEIHDKFGLSYAASNRALEDLKKWIYQKRYDSELALEDILSLNQQAIMSRQ